MFDLSDCFEVGSETVGGFCILAGESVLLRNFSLVSFLSSCRMYSVRVVSVSRLIRFYRSLGYYGKSR